jgi:hypothetical protein
LAAEVQRELDALEPGSPGRAGLLRIMEKLQRKPRRKKQVAVEETKPAPVQELDEETIQELKRRGLDCSAEKGWHIPEVKG